MSVLQCVKQTIKSQIARSRNAQDAVPQKIKRAFWVCVYLAFAFWVGVKWLRLQVLGEQVIYQGRRARVNNWANAERVSLVWDGGHEQRCEQKQIKTIYMPATFAFRFVSGFRFWAINWLAVEVDRRLYPQAFAESEGMT